MSEPGNPYAPPSAHVADIPAMDPAAEARRREHIALEAAVRSAGTLYVLGGLLGIAAGLMFVMAYLQVRAPSQSLIAIGSNYLALSVPAVAIGIGMRKLHAWSRMAMVIFTSVGVPYFPIGTFINGYVVYLLFSAKSKRLFEPQYAAIVAATPHVKRRTPLSFRIIVALQLCGMLAWAAVPLAFKWIDAVGRTG